MWSCPPGMTNIMAAIIAVHSSATTMMLVPAIPVRKSRPAMTNIGMQQKIIINP